VVQTIVRIVEAELPFEFTLPAESVDATTVPSSGENTAGLSAVVSTAKEFPIGEEVDRVSAVPRIRPLSNEIAVKVNQICPD
jgi:hypothetical protein